MGDTGYGPGRDRINEVMNKVIGKPILKVGPDNPGGYLTKGEYQAKLDHEDEVLGYIKIKKDDLVVCPKKNSQKKLLK